MPFGSSAETKSTGEQVSHFAAVRMRCVGDGLLTMTMYTLDDLDPVELIPFTLSETTSREPLRLMNYKHQRAYIEIATNDEINDFFKVSRIILFGKQLWTEYPGTE